MLCYTNIREVAAPTGLILLDMICTPIMAMFAEPAFVTRAIQLLIYIAGVGTTILGSWVSSKVRVYHDARNSHRDDLKEKVLEPLHTSLGSDYDAPRFEVKWGQKSSNPHASVEEVPASYGPVLAFSGPGQTVPSTLDEALFEDAKVSHYKKLMFSISGFQESWAQLRGRLEARLQVITQDLVSLSGLHPYPNPTTNGPYIMHLALANFIYYRLLQSGFATLDIVEQDGKSILQLGQIQSVAARPSDQMKNLIELINSLVETHRPFALEIQQDLVRLQTVRASLTRQLSLEIAGKRLAGRCSLVRFF